MLVYLEGGVLELITQSSSTKEYLMARLKLVGLEEILAQVA